MDGFGSVSDSRWYVGSASAGVVVQMGLGSVCQEERW